MKDRYLLFVISLLFCCLLQAQEKIDSLLVVLDRTIENTAQYEQARLKRIDQIKEYFRTRKSTSPSDEYHINQQLFDEYEAYICDSARHYINRNIEIALQHNNQEWLNEAKLKKASILGKTGLYAEGVALLKSIDSKQLSRDQLIEYYITFEDIYLYHAEYAMDDEYQIEYLNNLYIYRDSVLQMVEEGSYQYVIAYTPELLQQGRGEEAIEMLEVYHQKLSPDTRDYAVVTSILAFIYQSTGQREKHRFHHSFSTAHFPVLLREIQMISTAVFYSPVIVTLLWHAVLLKDTHDRASVYHHRHVAVMAADTRIHHLVKAGDAAVLELLHCCIT